MSSIKVAVRLRPLNTLKKERLISSLNIIPRRVQLAQRPFDFDAVFDADATQHDVFEQCFPVIEAVRDNLSNGTIAVYGQSGSGKTYTMLGSAENAYHGIAFTAMRELVDSTKKKMNSGMNASLSFSMLEIYNERVTDMLAAKQPEVTLYGGVPYAALKVHFCELEEARNIIITSLESRRVSQTAMNDRSSRSHVIIIVHVEEQDSVTGNTESTRLFLVDLAGSESIKKSLATGKVASEAGSINKSLLALKNVILTLSSSFSNSSTNGSSMGFNRNGNFGSLDTTRYSCARGGLRVEGVSLHVPYRDSKLTELLQDSIGGTARTMFIACISPVARDADETKSTLDYATRARSIRNISNLERDKLLIRCKSLELDLQRANNRLLDDINKSGGLYISKEEYHRLTAAEQLNVKLENDIQELTKHLEHSVTNNSVVSHKIHTYERELAAKEEAISKTKIVLDDVMHLFYETRNNFCATGDAYGIPVSLMSCSPHAGGSDSDETSKKREKGISPENFIAITQAFCSGIVYFFQHSCEFMRKKQHEIIETARRELTDMQRCMATMVKHISEAIVMELDTTKVVAEDAMERFNRLTNQCEIDEGGDGGYKAVKMNSAKSSWRKGMLEMDDFIMQLEGSDGVKCLNTFRGAIGRSMDGETSDESGSHLRSSVDSQENDGVVGVALGHAQVRCRGGAAPTTETGSGNRENSMQRFSVTNRAAEEDGGGGGEGMGDMAAAFSQGTVTLKSKRERAQGNNHIQRKHRRRTAAS